MRVRYNYPRVPLELISEEDNFLPILNQLEGFATSKEE